MDEKEHLIEVLSGVRKAILTRNILSLKDLSNQTIHSASIYQDTDSIAIAVVVYAMSKIIERREHENFNGCEEFCDKSLKSIDKALAALQKDDKKKFSDSLNNITKSVNKLSGNLRRYIQDVMRKSSINKASKIYEHGISLEQTANLLGISLYELASYTGQKEFSDIEQNKSISVKDRIKLVEKMFEK
ncbi:hypothetical protein COU57_02810 [Candidatus Pacearchaeota archaeon CG10_big_fil_rev_8_21_14_0_10_32_14]|nr:MAG: hypothetical protein COU57_02810 [Candidatus Pacearchaeota archaeon CG10_big_fil_rev_8_21_14_0_10_32_14]